MAAMENSVAVLGIEEPVANVSAVTISDGVDQSFFTISSNQLQFVTAPALNNPLDSNSDNVYEVELAFEDSNGDVNTAV